MLLMSMVQLMQILLPLPTLLDQAESAVIICTVMVARGVSGGMENTSAPHDTATLTVTAGMDNCAGTRGVGGAQDAEMRFKLQTQSRQEQRKPEAILFIQS